MDQEMILKLSLRVNDLANLSELHAKNIEKTIDALNKLTDICLDQQKQINKLRERIK